MSVFKHDRPTIGILPGWSGLAGIISDRYLMSVLEGIRSAARVKQCNLLLAWGLGRVTDTSGTFPAWPVVSPDADFVPVGPWNTDGFIVFAPLRHEARSKYLQELIDDGFPILFIATGENGPTISVDNEGGIYQALAHLVDHGHRRIAFVAGDPTDQGDSEIRLQAYHFALTKHGLETDPALISHGWHTFSGGYEATQKIIKSGVKFTAVIASDDNSAVGAMQAIREAGLEIPGDVAIIGFDDQPDTMAQVPPLASIHVPLAAIGEQALMLMFDHLIGENALTSIQIPTRLVPRQSCGCLPQAVSSAVTKETDIQMFISHSDEESLDSDVIIQKLVNEMTATLSPASRFPLGELTDRLSTSLVTDFYTSLKENSPIHFQVTLMRILQELEFVEENIDAWQNMISILRHEMTQLPGIWARPRTHLLAEDLLHQARTAISESVRRQNYRGQYQGEVQAQALSELTAQLNLLLDERQAVEALEARSPNIGVRHVRVARFEAEQDDPIGWSITLNPHSEASSQRFRTREFPPPTLYSANELLNLTLIPLVFQDEPIGYVAFDAENLGSCVIIARQLTATFKASQLHAQVLELSLIDPLTGIHNRRYFDLFLANEIDRSRRFERDLSILMLDIDYFKQYNDAFGHPAGDKALQFVALCLLQEHRNSDVIARIGGEEFALILPETDAGGAIKVAENIRTKLTKPSNLQRPLTLSIGISALRGINIEAEEIIQQADAALYQAKRTGRNRICVFDE